MYGYIYKTTNLVNGKIYIGRHKSSVFTNYKGSGKALWNAINKYGWDNFKVELLCECESSEELNEKEKFYIKEYNTKDKSIGYNISDGGEQGYPILSGKNNPMYGKRMSDESRKKMSDSQKGKTIPLEVRNKMSESHKGKKKSLETRIKMSEYQRNRVVSKETCRKISESLKGNTNGSGERSEEACKKMSESHKGKRLSQETIKKLSNITSNLKWINNGICNKRVSISDLDYYLNNGWIIGMLHKEDNI